MKGINGIKIGISGIRGIVGETLNPEQVVNLTRAFAASVFDPDWDASQDPAQNPAGNHL